MDHPEIAARRHSFLDRQINLLRELGKGEQFRPYEKYRLFCPGLDVLNPNDVHLARYSSKDIVQRRNELKEEDIGVFRSFSSLITSLWDSQDAVRSAQAVYLLKRLTTVMSSHRFVNPFNGSELSQKDVYTDKILYDEGALANLADAVMMEESQAGKTVNFSHMTACGPVAGNKIVFGKESMTVELTLPLTPGNPIANPLERENFTAGYTGLKPGFIQLEKDYLSKTHHKDKIPQVESQFENNDLPSRLAAEAVSIPISDLRELAMASAIGLCSPPTPEQRMNIENQILEYASSGMRPETVQRRSLPQDQGPAIPAIEITVTEAGPFTEYIARRDSSEISRLLRSQPDIYVYESNGILFKAVGKYLLFFKDGKLHFSFDYETAKPQDMVSRMQAGLGYLNAISNGLYQYFQLEPRTVILPLDEFREKTLVDFERLDHHTIEERVEHLGGYNADTLTRIEKFRDGVLDHFKAPEKGKPQNLFLTGPTGIGKTTVTRALVKVFGENGIPVYKLSDREPINTDTLSRTIKAFNRNKEGGVLIIEDLVDYLRNATDEQFEQVQASLIQTLKTVADLPNHVVIYNSERIDEIAQKRWALLQPQRTDLLYLEPDTTKSGIESLLRATMARSLSTDDQIVTKDSSETTEHLNRISGSRIAGFIKKVQQIDREFPGVGLTPNMIGTTSRTPRQAGSLNWKTATMEQILAEILHNMDNKSRLNPESPFERARLSASEYELLVQMLQEIERRGGLDGWSKFLIGPLLLRIDDLGRRVAALENSPPAPNV